MSVRYDLAYNQTDGAVADLWQSAQQAGIQWNSQVMSWLNSNGLAPDWFNQWFQKSMISKSSVVATEITQHVQAYSDAIFLGSKVLVVSHSQGNFYVNAAKKQLEQQLSAEQMRSFSIMGVAVPANNVGGESGPYYTNNRDPIYILVPTALPSNWNLTLSDSNSTVTLPTMIAAHGFVETYMNPDFSVRDPLVFDIKGLINKLSAPTPVCDDYRKHMVRFFAGSYDLREYPDSPVSKLVIQDNGTVLPPAFPRMYPKIFDYTPHSSYTLIAEKINFQGNTIFGGDIVFNATKDVDRNGHYYNFNKEGKFTEATNEVTCEPYIPGIYVRCGSPYYGAAPSYLKNLDLQSWMLLPLEGRHSVLTCTSALATSNPIPGVASGKKSKVLISLNGGIAQVNGASFSMINGVYRAKSVVSNELDSTVSLDLTLTNTSYKRMGISFSRGKGIKSFSISDDNGLSDLYCQ
jgi:hypothetical protein